MGAAAQRSYLENTANAVSATREEARAELELSSDRRYVLTICRLMVWKRVDNILKALVDLPEDVHLLVAGDGDMDVEWQRLAEELGVSNRVTWLGHVPHDQVMLFIRSADVFVLNSEYEGLSHTLLEVLHLGTPIVASEVCGNPEVVEDGENGLLVDPRDPVAVRSALARLLEDPALGRGFAEAGLARRGAFTRRGTFGEVEQVLAQAAGIANLSSAGGSAP